MTLITNVAYFQTCSCGECWGSIVTSKGTRGMFVASKQEARSSLKAAVQRGVLNDLERQIVEMQIDLSHLPTSSADATFDRRAKLGIVNMPGLELQSDSDLSVVAYRVTDRSRLEDGKEALAECDSFDDFVRDQIANDAFDREILAMENLENLPIC